MYVKAQVGARYNFRLAGGPILGVVRRCSATERGGWPVSRSTTSVTVASSPAAIAR